MVIEKIRLGTTDTVMGLMLKSCEPRNPDISSHGVLADRIARNRDTNRICMSLSLQTQGKSNPTSGLQATVARANGYRALHTTSTLELQLLHSKAISGQAGPDPMDSLLLRTASTGSLTQSIRSCTQRSH